MGDGGLLYYSLDISCTLEKFCYKESTIRTEYCKKTKIITYLSMLVLSQVIQYINLNNQPSPDL